MSIFFSILFSVFISKCSYTSNGDTLPSNLESRICSPNPIRYSRSCAIPLCVFYFIAAVFVHLNFYFDSIPTKSNNPCTNTSNARFKLLANFRICKKCVQLYVGCVAQRLLSCVVRRFCRSVLLSHAHTWFLLVSVFFPLGVNALIHL